MSLLFAPFMPSLVVVDVTALDVYVTVVRTLPPKTTRAEGRVEQ
jgi:hypothetical protein